MAGFSRCAHSPKPSQVISYAPVPEQENKMALADIFVAHGGDARRKPLFWLGDRTGLRHPGPGSRLGAVKVRPSQCKHYNAQKNPPKRASSALSGLASWVSQVCSDASASSPEAISREAFVRAREVLVLSGNSRCVDDSNRCHDRLALPEGDSDGFGVGS